MSADDFVLPPARPDGSEGEARLFGELGTDAALPKGIFPIAELAKMAGCSVAAVKAAATSRLVVFGRDAVKVADVPQWLAALRQQREKGT